MESTSKGIAMSHDLFYTLKPVIPRQVQILLRKIALRRKAGRACGVWPIDYRAGTHPRGWQGWPGGKKFAFVLTHDVDTESGQRKCAPLMKMEQALGFSSAFYIVPERYPVSPDLLRLLEANHFEIGVHGLHHDGKLFRSRALFEHRAARINAYLRDWKAEGFRAPSMVRNLDWIGDLAIRYDASTFDTDPFEPQPTGVGTIFPFWIPRRRAPGGYIELPYTLPQDFTLYVLMNEKNPAIWEKKLDWVAERGGMALLNSHPDYMDFSGDRGAEEYPVEIYREFLEYVKSRYGESSWQVLPRDLAEFWRTEVVYRGRESEDCVPSPEPAEVEMEPVL